MRRRVILVAIACALGCLSASGATSTPDPACYLEGYALPEAFGTPGFKLNEVILDLDSKAAHDANVNLVSAEVPGLKLLYCVNLTNSCVYKPIDENKNRDGPCDTQRDAVNTLNKDIRGCLRNDRRRALNQESAALANVVAGVVGEMTPGPAYATNNKGAADKPDEYFKYQRELQKMGALEAWRDVDAAPTIITAIVDSGVDLEHFDLMSPNRGFRIPCRDWPCDGKPTDDNDHGTNMAGTIAARMDATDAYSRSITGTAWNTEILSINAFQHGLITDAIAAKAIECAASKGARVINASFESTAEMTLTRRAIERVQATSLVVVPAGNGSQQLHLLNPSTAADPLHPCESYPACLRTTNSQLPNMIVAMSHDLDYNTDPVSNWGKAVVDIATPGTTFTTKIRRDGMLSYDAPFSGTSTATAFTSGAAALLWSKYPTWKPAQIRERMLNSAIKEPNLKDMLDGDRRLDLERMMHPVFFKPLDYTRSVRRSQLPYVDATAAFPAGTCSSEVSTQLRRVKSTSQAEHRPPVHELEPDPVTEPQLVPRDRLIIQAMCDGVAADSIVYTLED